MNLRIIARRLSHDLKLQLVHSCVLTGADLQKLQKLQNDAARFVFNLHGKKKYESISPYLKKL